MTDFPVVSEGQVQKPADHTNSTVWAQHKGMLAEKPEWLDQVQN